MPNRNGTGPEGNGPRTGRGRGPCQVDKQNNKRSGKQKKKSGK